MKINCDTEKMKKVSTELEFEIQRYDEIMKKFYNLVENFATSNTWVGNASKNYSRYLLNKKSKYTLLSDTMQDFNISLKNNIREIELAIEKSKVSEND